MDLDSDIIREGPLKKKKSRVNTWGERYFKLRHQSLDYYIKPNDTEPKGAFPLNHNCQVSKITSDVGKKRKQYVFKVSYRIEDDGDDKDEKDNSPSAAETPNDSKDKSKSKKKTGGDGVGAKVAAAAVGGVVVGALTSGIGLLAGMMVVGMGAAAGGSAAAMANNSAEFKEKSITLACNTYEDAEAWVSAIEAQVLELGDNVFGISSTPHRRMNVRVARAPPHPDVRIDEVEEWLNSTRWRACDTYAGLRILEPVYDEDQSYYESFFNPTQSKQIDVQTAPCLRVNLDVNASPSDAFAAIMSYGTSLRSGIIQSMRIVENLDNQTDIVHIKLNPIYLFPTWTSPRDFCLLRYWKGNNDGSFILCFDSTTHADCPLLEDYVRGEFHGAYVIAPPRAKAGGGNYVSPNKDNDDEDTECLISFIAQVDPKGWIWNNYGYKHSFLREVMLHVFDLRDALESERFLQAHFDPVEPAMNSTVSIAESNTAASPQGTMATIPPPILSPTMWAESEAASFKVRGLTYNTDKVKVSSAPSLFKLLAIDFFEVPETTHNIASHPRNRVNMALQRGDPSWVFVVNIMVPGPPFLSFVVYFLADKSLIDADTPFGRVARPFFYGNDDEFRNNRFKLIPKVIDGNLIIKMAVKDTPTLLGNKLKQYYYKGDNYFELDVDVGSSSVARNVVGLALGYSKAIVVDMGFCLQGNEEDELPEVLMGTCSCIHVDASTAKKL